MTDATTTAPLPAAVTQEATREGVLPLGGITLIGLFGKPGDMRALLRNSRGKIISANIGDKTPAGQVVAITPEQVVFMNGDKTQALAPVPLG